MHEVYMILNGLDVAIGAFYRSRVFTRKNTRDILLNVDSKHEKGKMRAVK